MKEKINNLYGSDNNLAYKTLLELEIEAIESNELYAYFEELLNMLKNEKSFIRVRGFRLICSLAKWDKDEKITKNIGEILEELEDEIGTSIRQCLGKINLILIYKPELSNVIEKKLNSIDISKYKDNMQPLIRKDIGKILENI